MESVANFGTANTGGDSSTGLVRRTTVSSMKEDSLPSVGMFRSFVVCPFVTRMCVESLQGTVTMVRWIRRSPRLPRWLPESKGEESAGSRVNEATNTSPNAPKLTVDTWSRPPTIHDAFEYVTVRAALFLIGIRCAASNGGTPLRACRRPPERTNPRNAVWV